MVAMSGYKETIEKVMAGGYDDASDKERNEAVRKITKMSSIAAGAVAIQPIPLVDVALITPIQILQVQAIGHIRGYKLDKKAVLEILSTFGASIVAQNVLMAAAKFVPFLGWIVAPSMAYALTWAIGEVADYYFSHGRGVPSDELRSMFDKVYKQKKTEKQEDNKSNETLKDKLEQLNEAFKSGLIDEAEFTKRKEKLLEDF
jgi:uncharacterized protein (DUF697 family)